MILLKKKFKINQMVYIQIHTQNIHFVNYKTEKTKYKFKKKGKK